ncbi:hypothetical protein IWW50_001830 [Coemansia erecta]|nr:hypothetical protein GGF43_001289 [Coemansia sp. RSA 2618]KAJ2827568.1 hypothetical protein IWW50_001830 [Coemansia erecta]
MAEQPPISPHGFYSGGPEIAHSGSRTSSVASARTESSDDSLSGTLAALTANKTGDCGHHVPRSSQSDSGRRSARASCPESLLLQRNHSLRSRGHKTQPTHHHYHFGSKFTRSESHNSRPSRVMAIDDPLDVLNDLGRFSQENYLCSFCSRGEPTFEKLLDHISVDHPWYDLTMHRNIR